MVHAVIPGGSVRRSLCGHLLARKILVAWPVGWHWLAGRTPLPLGALRDTMAGPPDRMAAAPSPLVSHRRPLRSGHKKSPASLRGFCSAM